MKIKNLTASVHQYPVFLPIIDKPLEHRVFTFCEVETDEGHKAAGQMAVGPQDNKSVRS
jgi:L-alanine-DL-glutamate epimerase-like enolase superfamily enzyme